ncbi:MAG: UDP-N-acetylenolpyruvoylglucosamine reductase, partial [Proteobacteria bacterium]|nr:UDP-N-acetylenolpyruvoylglucosamine reductase [Pseudomonadota bacterium]
MFIERNVSLQALNSFGIAARAAHLARVRSEQDVRAVLADADLAVQHKSALGGGSNIVLTG